MEDTVAITANYASPFNIAAVWETLVDFDADYGELEQVYCHILTKTQQDDLLGHEYNCNNTIHDDL
jgi:hypothetical protein